MPFEVLRVELAGVDSEADEVRVAVGERPMIPSGDEDVLVAELAVVLVEVDVESTAPDDGEGRVEEIRVD